MVRANRVHAAGCVQHTVMLFNRMQYFNLSLLTSDFYSAGARIFFFGGFSAASAGSFAVSCACVVAGLAIYYTAPAATQPDGLPPASQACICESLQVGTGSDAAARTSAEAHRCTLQTSAAQYVLACDKAVELCASPPGDVVEPCNARKVHAQTTHDHYDAEAASTRHGPEADQPSGGMLDLPGHER
jgi:hypothetical protein